MLILGEMNRLMSALKRFVGQSIIERTKPDEPLGAGRDATRVIIKCRTGDDDGVKAIWIRCSRLPVRTL